MEAETPRTSHACAMPSPCACVVGRVLRSARAAPSPSTSSPRARRAGRRSRTRARTRGREVWPSPRAPHDIHDAARRAASADRAHGAHGRRCAPRKQEPTCPRRCDGAMAMEAGSSEDVAACVARDRTAVEAACLCLRAMSICGGRAWGGMPVTDRAHRRPDAPSPSSMPWAGPQLGGPHRCSAVRRVIAHDRRQSSKGPVARHGMRGDCRVRGHSPK